MIIFTNKTFPLVRRALPTYILSLLLLSACGGNQSDAAKDSSVLPGENWELLPPEGVQPQTSLLDSMDVKNPFITYERSSNSYYMVGDGGHMWLSKDLRLWNGPYNVLRHDASSWLGSKPLVSSPEIHKHGNRYYYMATFEVPGDSVAAADGRVFTRRSCVSLVADSITGPYKTIDKDAHLLDVSEMAEHPTYCSDDLDVGYMIYNCSCEQNGNGTVQIVRYTENLANRMGEAYVMFTAQDVPWSSSPLMESPFLFYTEGGLMGMLFTAMAGGEKAVGVAYSTTGMLDGPWEIEPEPLLKGVGGAMMFRDYDGSLVLVAGKDTVIGGVTRSVQQLYRMDSQFEKLQVKRHYKF